MQETLPVSNLSQFIDRVDRIQKEWTEIDGEYVQPWFRGHSNCENRLLPGLYRNEKEIENENSYRSEFAQKAFPFLADSAYGVPASDWEWYFLMQHYGLPTRLLDWSEGSLIALHFALFFKTDSDYANPCVWMLNPYELSRLWKSEAFIYLFTAPSISDYLPAIWAKEPLPGKPIAIQPVYKSKRIVVQKGMFTIHGSEKTPLEDIAEMRPWLKKIIVNYKDIDLVKAELQMAGITQSSLFPELSGLAQELREYWK